MDGDDEDGDPRATSAAKAAADAAADATANAAAASAAASSVASATASANAASNKKAFNRLQSGIDALAGSDIRDAAHAAALLSFRRRPTRQQTSHVVCSVSQQSEDKVVVMKNSVGDLPIPYSDKDPYKLPLSIERVQRMLFRFGWEKPWIEQIVDRIMKGMLKTTEERTQAVVDYLISIGLRQDEICNMASISVVLLGLNPQTRLASIVNYLKERGVPAGSIPSLVLKHPRIFEYKLMAEGSSLSKGKARIQVDVIPAGLSGEMSAAVTYYREGASFLVSPVSPIGPLLP
ncbi:MAG: hypothetical protein WDW38_005834 [Sanguina aurantia]